MIRVHLFFATGFYVGYSPIAPGTAGSLLMILIFLLLPALTIFSHLLLILIISILGVWSSTRVAEKKGKDPSIVVIDEMAGMSIALLACPVTIITFLTAFLAFRLFDIFKPFPIRKSENLPGGWGIMMDDIMAGLFSFFLVQFLITIKIL